MNATGAFVLTTGRCGSTLLSSILALHPDVLSVSEFFTFLGGGRAFDHGRLSGSDFCDQVLLSSPPEVTELLRLAPVPEVLRAQNGGGPNEGPLLLVALPALTNEPELLLSELVGFARALPVAAVGDHYGAVLAWLCVRLSRRIWVERSGGSIEYADCILRRWPSARIIHLWRNGVDCARSMSRHPYFRLLVARAHLRNPSLPVQASLEQDISLERFGAYWSAITIRGVRVLGSLPEEQVLHVAYEDLAASPNQEMRRIFAFLGLAPDEGILRMGVQRVLPRRQPEDREAAELTALQRTCLPGRRALERLLSRASSATIGGCR